MTFFSDMIYDKAGILSTAFDYSIYREEFRHHSTFIKFVISDEMKSPSAAGAKLALQKTMILMKKGME